MLNRILAVSAALLSLALAAPAARASDAGFLLLGGPIHIDAGGAPVQALVVRDGKVAFAGSLANARLRAQGLPELDLKGAAAFPGFMDSHVHLTGVGLREMTLNLDQVKSVTELVSVVKAWEAAHPGAEPLVGRGWIETHWPEKRFPGRADLDAVSATRPIVLERADGHAMVLNGAALRLAGIDRTTRDPAGGRIERDASGEATGMLIDGAMGLIEPKLPPLSYARRKEALARGTALYAARGWTAGANMSTSAEDVKALFELAAAGRLPIRVDAFMTPEDSAEVLKRGPYADPTGLVRVRGVKLYMDGALGSRGAALKAPYADRPDSSGLTIAEHDPTEAILKQALETHCQIAFHAIGDRGNRMVLDWMIEAFKTNGPGAAQTVWRIEHAQIVDPADIALFAKSGVVASMQPSHAIGDLYFAPARLGEARLKGAYAWKSLHNAGVIVAGGTDAPVEVGDPRIEYYAAVARKDLQGKAGADWHPEEALARDEALGLFTAAGAYAVQDKGRGSLKPGAAADITVFSSDVTTVPEAEILKVRPLLTLVGGKIVHDGR
ncbi:amidohydrolase [Caulobacter mirabilis]|uniref:amidohydrolase n=1 Tax=Caulobacter mirabilis TaxID=69666 RepID=UPI0026A644BA